MTITQCMFWSSQTYPVMQDYNQDRLSWQSNYTALKCEQLHHIKENTQFVKFKHLFK